MLVCKIDDFDYTLSQFCSECIGKDQTGRKICKSISSKKTAWGDIKEDEWYRVAKELITIGGETEVLETIKEHCRKLAWLKKEEDVERYAIGCMLHRSYEHWPETRELSKQRSGKWIFYFKRVKILSGSL